MKPNGVLEAELSKFVGQTPWRVTGSPPTGADFSLKFGERVEGPPIKPGGNPSITGSYSLFVTCSWRLERDNVAILASGDDVLFDETLPVEVSKPFAIVAGLDPLLGQSVQSVALRCACDMEMEFGDGLVLLVFCNRSTTRGAGPRLCYSVRTPGRQLLVSHGSVTVHEE